MDLLTGKTIASVPKLANWTPFAFVVDSFLVRAANYRIGHRDRWHSMILHIFQYLSGDCGVSANVAAIRLPVTQLFHLCIVRWHDANNDLRRLAPVWTVERNRRNWPTPQALPGSLAQALEEPIFGHHFA